MSLWSDFTDALKGVAKGVATGGIGGGIAAGFKEVTPLVKDVATPVAKAIGKQAAKTGSGIMQGFGAAGFTPGEGPGNVVAKAGVQIGTSNIINAAQATTGQELTEKARKSLLDINTAATERQVKQYDPLLQSSILAEEKVFSPLIKRPISTAALLADPTSPLYDAGQYGSGVQLTDVAAAYNRTGDVYEIVNGKKVLKSPGVSLGVSLSKTLLNAGLHVTGLSDNAKEAGLDLDKANLWDDNDVQKYFVDNTLGRYMSGLTDAVVGNVAIQAGISGGLALVKSGAKAAGFVNTLNVKDVETLTKLEDLATTHINGTQKTVFGSDIDRLAASKDINEILDILEPHSNNPRLANLVMQTEDPSVVRDFILADKGYGPAIERLATLKRSDDLWIMSDAGKEHYADFVKNGQYRELTVEQRQRAGAAFDDSIAKNPKHQEIYDAFLRDETIKGPITPDMAARGIEPGQIDSVPRVFGKNYVPAEPKILNGVYTNARKRASELRVATVTRDYSNVGGVTQRLVGRGGATTALIKFVSTKMPRGVVTNSGIRPLDAIEEINAHFDDIAAFRSGNKMIKLSPVESIPASEYRRRFIAKYLEAQSDGQRGIILDELNKILMRDVARTQGITRLSDIDKFVEDAMNNIRKYQNDLADNSFAMDPSGMRVKVDPETQRQLRNATPLLPVAEIERQIIAARRGKGAQAAGVGVDVAQFGFELGNKAFSFTQLVRPSYIGKNSIIEPMLVSTMSLGSKVLTDNFRTYSSSILEDMRKNATIAIRKAKNLNSSEKKALADDFTRLTEQANESVQMLDNHVAEWIDYFVAKDGVSPATRLSNSEIVKRELRAAERVIRDIEVKMNAAAPEFSASFDKLPSLYNLTRRTQYLKTLKDPKYGSDIANAEAAISRAAGDINTLAPDLNKINQSIADEYKKIEAVFAELGPVQIAKAKKFSVADNKVVESSTKDTFSVRLANGEVIDNIPTFGNKQNLGTAYQSEIANTHTRQIELTGDKIFAQKVNMFNRKGPTDITDMTSPAYFDELSYVVNNYMRGDVLIDRILAGESRESLLANWAGTRQARSYAAEFGKNPSDIVAIIDNQIAYINRYLPNQQAQLLAAQGEVKASALAGALAEEMQTGILTPIHPMDVNYSVKTSGLQNFSDAIDKLTSAAWVKLATPENKIRYAWASTEYKQIVAEKAQLLASQGYEMTPSVIQGIRQSAAAEVVQELERTFYSIRRANRGLYTARTVAAFPTAAASGIYRYSRLAVKNPDRFSVLLNSYQSLYNTFGVDKNGNKVDNPLDAEFFIVPGTKEMGLGNGEGWRLGARATNFAVNFAGPAYTVPIGLGTIYNMFQGTDKIAKKIVNETIGHLPGYSYDELFPYGVETNVAKQLQRTVTPGWYSNAYKYFFGDDGTVDFTNSLLSEYKYQTILYENGLGPKPTDKSIENAARRKYGQKAAWQFASLIGSPVYVETKPASIFQTLFNAKADAAVAQGYSRSEAAQIAEDYLNLHVNLPKGSISKDLLKQKSSGKVVYVPRTQETVDRIWKDHADLAKQLELNDPRLVGLMTADLPMGTDPQVGKFLDDPNRSLPGGNVLNKRVKSVKELENDLEKSRFWKAYTDLKNEYNNAAKAAGYASYLSVPELKDSLRSYAKTLGAANNTWGIEYGQGASGDNAALFANGMAIALNNKKYMEQYGNGQFWQHANALLQYRDSYAKLYSDAPAGTKGYVQEKWVEYLNSSLKQWDPALQNLINIYFINDNLKETVVKIKETK
jgi:hypothetical protein